MNTTFIGMTIFALGGLAGIGVGDGPRGVDAGARVREELEAVEPPDGISHAFLLDE